MHVVVELPGFVAAAKEAGLSDDARTRIIDRVAGRPDAGDVIPGTGGARKVRFAGRGKGQERRLPGDHVLHGGGPAGVRDHAVLEGRAD